MTEEVAILEGVAKDYGRQAAVRPMDLVLRAGETIGLIGHNGAGKSTLMKLMLGLIRPSAGRISVLGENPAAGRAASMRLKIGYLPENVSFAPSMTGAEVLSFYARLKRQSVDANRGLLELVGIVGAADRRVGTYSKGMRQRLGLAQALLGKPRFLLLDEPTTGLDPGLRASFYNIVHSLREGGATVLLSSHALSELEEHVDRLVVMDGGRKVADSTSYELRRNADLPVRIVVTVPKDITARSVAALDPDLRWRLLSARQFEVVCTESRKTETVRRIAALPGRIEDIDIRTPSLNDVYAAITGRAVPDDEEFLSRGIA
jgi:Cu-processing system ATP-binding protein